jgi:hypothetical protein
MSGPDEEFDDFLSRRKPLFRRAAGDPLEPPEEVDRIVLRQAREAIEIDRPQPAFRGAHWGAPLAIAATLLVVFTVVLHVLGLPKKPIPEVTVQQVTQQLDQPPPPAPAAVPAPGAQPQAGPEYRRDSHSWLAQIERLRAAGKSAEADAELAEYKRKNRAYAGAPDR